MVFKFWVIETRHNFHWAKARSFGTEFSKEFFRNETCSISILNRPEQFPRIFKTWNLILTKLFNYEILYIFLSRSSSLKYPWEFHTYFQYPIIYCQLFRRVLNNLHILSCHETQYLQRYSIMNIYIYIICTLLWPYIIQKLKRFMVCLMHQTLSTLISEPHYRIISYTIHDKNHLFSIISSILFISVLNNQGLIKM